MIRIELPKALNCYVDGKSVLELRKHPANVGAALAELGELSPGVLDRVMDEQGAVRQHVNVFLGSENIRFLKGLETPVPDGSTILILSAISGG